VIRVLAVDDHAGDRFMLEKRLRMVGFTTRGAADGQEALELIRRWQPDLVLLDLLMGGLSGFDVLRARAANDVTARVPMIVVSSAADDESRQECFALGAAEYLIKPVDLDALVPVIGRQLARHGGGRVRGAG
jgi:CheY-like chemotaxis protein